MIGKVAAYVEKTKLDKEGNKVLDIEAYLDVRFPSIKIADGTHHSSNMCRLILFDEIMKVASFDDGNLSKLDEGTAVLDYKKYLLWYKFTYLLSISNISN